MRSGSRWGWALLLSLLLCGGAAMAVEKQVTAYNTYVLPPFASDADASGRTPGLAQELVDALNRQLKGRVHLTLENVPRIRLLKQHLDRREGFDGIVLFLAPAFVDDATQPRWLWTRPLFEDRNVLVFLRGQMAAPRQLADLRGKRFGVVPGFRYADDIREMMSSNQVSVADASSELAVLRNIHLKRIDITQMNQLMFRTMSARPEFEGQLAAASLPTQRPFGRRILIGRHQPALAQMLDEAVAHLGCDKRWQQQLHEQGVEAPSCPTAARAR